MQPGFLFRFCVFALAVWFAHAAVTEKKKYTTKYDNIDIEDVIKNDRLLKNYVDCLLEKGICTPDGLELKKNMPDAIETDCSKCSEKQKDGSDKMIRFLIDNKPELWAPLQEKYDPTGSYKKRYLANKSDVNIEPVHV
ncbi:PREDICTED: ejaculatory bulb-specific protein 3-like isoform X2 [Nicrophorus vespilloides]|nr:PREDICTED: ejaculatory bulb-specific protein 3-like isoform X2 [Nicrophorus vespilloides]XP_017779651.1 PREDICTED: ejaculatory bulb-specific protein 3-like isoform X2 [Nicrophorus vespilloides]XP_017779652.1 PREDICTED: ejaculatory bulb-specific protein 3-like isoform X2 [Nicrophorus vespilloides]XP_017779653.1 PREDICTED: ejaculatory bulb-specific protein 3-like isoform X2 [Nicrophorus vespilloides]XP_017779654.1 PREDICTED: ejaculatory bulb-specific protein 3-like isoform X2 [Nicrophorus vesp